MDEMETDSEHVHVFGGADPGYFIIKNNANNKKYFGEGDV